MATITLKNLPEPLHRALQDRAAANHRSLNREAIACLEQTVLGHPMDVDAFLASVRTRRRQTPGRLTEALLREARQSGRP